MRRKAKAKKSVNIKKKVRDKSKITCPLTKKNSNAAGKELSQFTLQNVRGMRDILPVDQPYWQQVRKTLERAQRDFGFSRIDIPIVEYAALFDRSVGRATDIVEKQMYTFQTRGGEKVALRPEFTAGIARAYIQHGMQVRPKPVKLFYIGPCYRYDRPQDNRFREFYQAGFEVFGEIDPVLDAQMIQVGCRIINRLGIKNVVVEVNSIGCPQCRKTYRSLLVSYFESKKNRLCIECKRRLLENPLRILDCKEDKCVQVSQAAPQSIDHLCEECRNHFRELLEYLEELEINFEISSSLVRGLEYYTKTVFEFFVFGSDGAKKNALGGGGRFDGLVKFLGGEDTPAVGFALGIDRLVNEMKKIGVKLYKEPRPKVFLAQLGAFAKKKSLKMFEALERSGILVAESFGRGSLKSQLKLADKLGVEITLILGQKEALDETVIIKEMATGVQEVISGAKVVDEVKKRLKNISMTLKRVIEAAERTSEEHEE